MRTIILTTSLRGFASIALPYLASEPKIDIAMVVFSQGQSRNRWKLLKRNIKKVFRVGVLGAVNGVRIRPWFSTKVSNLLKTGNLLEITKQLGIRLEYTPITNSRQTIELFQEANAELGLSLGCGYISKRVFSVPKYGMINVHHEVLPRFQGAQSVIWQIYKGINETGFTIHQIDTHIDTGDILYTEKLPLELKSTLRETVIHNRARVLTISAEALVKVVADYRKYKEHAKPQGQGESFTTPTFWQYIRMVRQHKQLLRIYGEKPKAACKVT